MIKTHYLYSNFSAGEISPRLGGRVDLSQYFNGASEITNWVCVQQGGVKTRGGFHFVQETKNSGEARLIPFSFSELQNYILLFGDKYIWFFTDKGFIVTRYPAGLRDSPTPEQPTRPYTTQFTDLTRTTLAPNNTSSYIPEAGFSYGNTRFIGNVLPSTTPYQVETTYEVSSDLWALRYDQDDENLYIVHPEYPPMVLSKGAGNVSFSINRMEFIDGPYLDEVNDTTITPSAISGSVTLTASAGLFQPGHVGALWRLNHLTVWSWVKITGYTSPTQVTATVMSDVTVAGATTSHREGSWSDVNGYPRRVCFSEGRIIFASTYEQPQTIWGSKTNDYYDFTPGVLANDSYSFTPSTLNIIRWILPGRVLAIGAMNAEATAVGDNDGPISPAAPPTITIDTRHGSSNLINPIRVGNSIIFLQRANRKLREFIYSYVNDAYGAPDITIASEHLFQYDIIDLIFQQEQDSLLWAIRNDTSGSLLSCAYDRNVEESKSSIVAWSKHYTDGKFESIATIPYQEEDQLWAIANRTIGGVEKRYVEYYDNSISVDSGLTYSGSPITVLGGLTHLAGKTVKIVGDGAVYAPQVVPISGEITITPAASEIYLGLGFTPTIITNRPEVQPSGGGSSQGLKKRWNKVVVRVLDTTGLTINGEVYPARATEDLMDEAPATYTADISLTNLGWDTDGRITIAQALPLPAHVVAVFGTLTVGDD